ncbi:hypothetical protein [Halorarius halobius]|uniref:hypothetical protein n=1 Tax=Halorarius halobius TaxID=2962671 RepID=UPI0020CF104E|nr:hypothetical protein [Halorarius halobius]
MQLQVEMDLLSRLLENLLLIAWLALAAGLLGAVVAAVHRWYARSRVPEGLTVLIGLSGVAAYLSTTSALGTVISPPPGGAEVLEPGAIVINTLTLGVSALAAAAGGRSADRLTEVVVDRYPSRGVDVSGLVRAGGRVITVELPEDIEDIEGYDPVRPEQKESLAGETLVFPRGLTVEELRERLVARLRSDYGVGHVDVDVNLDGEVQYLAVGSREAGLGPTLPPETCAVAIQADPAFAASAGDIVQVYRPAEEGYERVCSGELRGAAENLVTLAVDAADVSALDQTTRYRLVTLPVEPRSDREFASLLRAAEETMAVVTLADGSSLLASTVGAVDASVVAVRGVDGTVDPIPARSRALSAGESLYVIARPDRLRKLDAAARAGGDND